MTRGGHKRTGPTTPAGKRAAAGNAHKHGAWSLPVTLAGRYAAAVLQALGEPGEKFRGPEIFKGGTGTPAPAPAGKKGIRHPPATMHAD